MHKSWQEVNEIIKKNNEEGREIIFVGIYRKMFKFIIRKIFCKKFFFFFCKIEHRIANYGKKICKSIVMKECLVSTYHIHKFKYLSVSTTELKSTTYIETILKRCGSVKYFIQSIVRLFSTADMPVI